jgi:hypothetical protein
MVELMMRTMCLSADVTSPRCLISDLTSFIEPSPKLAGIWIVEFLLKLRSRYRRPQKVKWLTNCTGASKVQTVPEKNALKCDMLVRGMSGNFLTSRI